jgi:hypothetical protein
LTDHALAEITDTTIDLRRTERKEGDLLYFRPSIVKEEGSATVLGATHDMRVRMGTYIDVSAGGGVIGFGLDTLAKLGVRFSPGS